MVHVAPSLNVSPGPGLVGTTAVVARLNRKWDGAVEREEAEADVASMTAALMRLAIDEKACMVRILLMKGNV